VKQRSVGKGTRDVPVPTDCARKETIAALEMKTDWYEAFLATAFDAIIAKCSALDPSVDRDKIKKIMVAEIEKWKEPRIDAELNAGVARSPPSQSPFDKEIRLSDVYAHCLKKNGPDAARTTCGEWRSAVMAASAAGDGPANNHKSPQEYAQYSIEAFDQEIAVEMAEDAAKTPPTGSSCADDWKLCRDNSDIANHWSGWTLAQVQCRDAANEKSEFGKPEWPWFYFKSFWPGRNYIERGIAIVIDDETSFPNQFNAMQRARALCTYDLSSKKVVNIAIERGK
jgi:hypothetical protein